MVLSMFVPEIDNMDVQEKVVLLVDDEPDILEFLEYNLRKEGIIVHTASNGVEAIAKAKILHPHLIVLDIMMPEKDGIETCRELRALPEFNQTPIAFLTARDEDYTQINALEIGGDDFITKPIRPKVFISRIKALLRRSGIFEPDEAVEVTVGTMTINSSKYQVHVGSTVHEFPRKEFEIIWLLASRPSHVFTRNEIYQKIWGDDVIVGQRTIDVHIRKIREKLGDDRIKTLKGVGYKLE
jgi:two-component system, OmpR family, alkaline phosphatase synthesis response regulator PhoP